MTRVTLGLLGIVTGGGLIAFGTLAAGCEQPPTPPRKRASVSLYDATVLILSHLAARRTACAVFSEDVAIEPVDGHRRRVYIDVLTPCLRAIDELPCVQSARWSGVINESESAAPDECLAAHGLRKPRPL